MNQVRNQPLIRTGPASPHLPVPVVILGGGETALGLLRAFASRHIPSLVYAPAGDMVCYSRWYRPVRAPAGLAVHDLLPNLPPGDVVLCPTSDHTVEELASLPTEQRERCHASVPSLDVVRDFTDKGRFAALLARAQVPAPWTCLLTTERDVDALPENLFPRLILKPCDSIAFHRQFGVKAFWGSSRQQVLERFHQSRQVGLSLVAQEYISGGPTACYLIDGFIDRRGQLGPLLARQKRRIYPTDFGNPSYQISVPLAEVQPAVNHLVRLMQSVPYRGIFSALFKYDQRTGDFKLLEVNARPYWYVGFTRHCGIDLAWLYYRDALGAEASEQVDYRVGLRCVYPYYDLQHVHATPCSLARWLCEAWRAWQPIFCWQDPLPAVAGSLRMLWRSARTRQSKSRQGS